MSSLEMEDPVASNARSILFLCGMNAIRSPMAEAIARSILPSGYFVSSAGVTKGDPDPFVAAILAERSLTLPQHEPHALDELGDNYFDLIVTLSPEAHHRALEQTRSQAVEVEYWPTQDPSVTVGTRDQILDQYRALRDALETRIRQRFKTSIAHQGT